MPLLVAVSGSAQAARSAAPTGKPIVIGAAIDLTKNMAPFDAPALEAAQIEIAKINAAGGVDGRPLELKYLNDQLDPQPDQGGRAQARRRGRQHRLGHLRRRLRDPGDPGVPAGEAPDRLAVHRHRPDGAVALRLGRQTSPSPSATPAQHDGAAIAEYAYSRGWHTADVVTDKLLVYFQNVCQGFTDRFKQLGGKIVDSESFTQGDKTINNVATRDQRQAGAGDRVLHLVRHRPARLRRQPAHARQQHADHRRLGERRRLLVVEVAEDHELLLRDLRGGGRAPTPTRPCARSRRR